MAPPHFFGGFTTGTHIVQAMVPGYASKQIVEEITLFYNHMLWLWLKKKRSFTLMQHGSLVKIPKHPPQKQFLLLEARTHLAWVEDENVQEHQPDEQALFCPSVKYKDRKCSVQLTLRSNYQ